MFHRKQPTKTRKIVELNRNYALIIGLVLFVFLADQFETDTSLCYVLAFATHFTWLVVFAWTCKYIYVILKFGRIFFGSNSFQIE